MAREINRDEAAARIQSGAALLDSQGPGKFERKHITGAIHGRIDDPEATLKLLGDDLDREIVVYCTDQACTGSALASKLLEGRGYRNVLRYTDGLADWANAGLPINTNQSNLVRDEVQRFYATAATLANSGQAVCCGPNSEKFGAGLYDDLSEVPGAAALASIGCGNPIAVADLHEGETVLDLGSGGGIDVLLSAKRVGSSGFAYGLDMTPEMLELARRNAADAGATNVEFLLGHIEDIPLPDAAVDVVISNCVINLSTDKTAVFSEMHRVLRVGGRIGISDVVTEDNLTAAQRAERGSYVGCIAGALSAHEYIVGLQDAGFDDVTVAFTHAVGDGIHSAVIKATKRND